MDEGVDPTEPTAIRTLTFWQDGFSIDDGDLRDYQDPANQEILRAIDGGCVCFFFPSFLPFFLSLCLSRDLPLILGIAPTDEPPCPSYE